MKKLLLATTALVSLVAGSAHAEGPTVTVGGSYDFQAGFADQKNGYETGASSRNGKFANETKINVKASGKSDNGLTYGAVVELEGDITASNDNSGLNSDRTYLFLESGLGRVELGSNVGAARTLKVDASSFARATGGIDGDWYHFVNTAVTTPAGGFLFTPDLPLDAGRTARGDSENATKITYYSPRYSGLQVGVSYTPDSGNRGTAAAFTTNSDLGQFDDVFDLGVNYTGQFDQIGVTASATGEFGSAESGTQEDLGAYALGLNVSYAGFTVGGSYGDLRDSGAVKGSFKKNQNDYWTLGAAYVQGPVGVSVSYLDSERQGNDFTNLSVGADYQLAPGLVPYAEVSFFDIDPAGANAKNSGTAFLLGTQLNF